LGSPGLFFPSAVQKHFKQELFNDNFLLTWVHRKHKKRNQMEFTLETLDTSRLTHLEAGQLLRRHLADLSTIDRELATDAPYNQYVADLEDRVTGYEQGVARIQKNKDTENVKLADVGRDKAISALGRSVRVFEVSDVAEEVEAARVLNIVLGNLRNLSALNYEAETLAIDKLTGDLESEEYAGRVALLNIGRYVERLKAANQNFKTIFGSRIQGQAMEEVFDMKMFRTETFKKYNQFCSYVLAMANATQAPLFVTAVNLLNAGRKYYADLLARRTAGEADEEEETPSE
jgi:hypothetical protein